MTEHVLDQRPPWPLTVRPTRVLRERWYGALIRSKAPWAERRQFYAHAAFYGAEPPAAEAAARKLIGEAQKHFRCDARFLIVDKVL